MRAGELEALRVSGEIGEPTPRGIAAAFQGLPPPPFRMLVLEICIDAIGTVTHVDIVWPTDDRDQDRRDRASVFAWAYRPYMRHGVSSPVCGPRTIETGTMRATIEG